MGAGELQLGGGHFAHENSETEMGREGLRSKGSLLLQPMAAIEGPRLWEASGDFVQGTDI